MEVQTCIANVSFIGHTSAQDSSYLWHVHSVGCSWKCEFNTCLWTRLFFIFFLINMVDWEYVIPGPGLDHLFWKFSSLSSLLLKFLFDIPFLRIFKTHFFCCGCDSSINTGAHVVLGKIESYWSEAKSPPFHGDFCSKQETFCTLRMMLRWPVETLTFAGRIWRWAFISQVNCDSSLQSWLLCWLSVTFISKSTNAGWRGHICWGACLPV